jgi:hypothetical protein
VQSTGWLRGVTECKRGQGARGPEVLRDPDGAALRGACDPGRIALEGGIVVTVGKVLKVVVLHSALSRTILSFWPSGLAPAREEYGAPLTLDFILRLTTEGNYSLIDC